MFRHRIAILRESARTKEHKCNTNPGIDRDCAVRAVNLPASMTTFVVGSNRIAYQVAFHHRRM